MAVPWECWQQVSVGSSNIVEDMQLGLDLAIAGTAPQLCPDARLRGAAAPDRQAATQQRTRWEHGHVQTLLTQTPRLVWQGLRQGRPALLGLALEVGVPPLSLVVVIWAIVFMGCVILWQGSLISGASVAILGASVFFFASSLFAGWLKHGRSIISLWVILFSPLYILWKLPIYVKLLFSRQKSWLRTKRL
jgi:cellulose synthase/poly-beta-1,6-N-acetylglucosamine synthase-like glycosyltransferase